MTRCPASTSAAARFLSARRQGGIHRGGGVPETAPRLRGEQRNTQDAAGDENAGDHGQRGHEGRGCPACPQPARVRVSLAVRIPIVGATMRNLLPA